ncbi:MAG: hypothetical protein E3J35_02375 [Methanomassiliicoccales archaeon]|nr:MAG: hypothetical protein E3J35_02375 [Methanomassiliicoccales archaeon]
MKVRTCSKCGQQFSPQGIRLHEKACDGSKREEVISPQETTDNTHEPPVSPEGQGGADVLPIKQADYVYREGKEGGICPHCGLELDEDDLFWHSLSKNGKDTNLYRCPECKNEFSSPSEVAIPELFDLVGELKKRFETLENGMVELVEKSVKEGQTKSEKARLEQAEEVRTEFSKEIESLKEKVNEVVEDEEGIEKTVDKLVEERMAGLLQKIDKRDQELKTWQKERDERLGALMSDMKRSIDALNARSRKPPCEHDFVDMRKVSGGNYFICSICGEKQEIL